MSVLDLLDSHSVKTRRVLQRFLPVSAGPVDRPNLIFQSTRGRAIEGGIWQDRDACRVLVGSLQPEVTEDMLQAHTLKISPPPSHPGRGQAHNAKALVGEPGKIGFEVYGGLGVCCQR